MLFKTMQDLRDDKNPMDLDRARVVTEVAGKIIDSAKVEVEFVRAVGGTGSGFVPSALPAPAAPAGSGTAQPGVTVHKIR